MSTRDEPCARECLGASQMCKNLDSPHPLTLNPMFGIRRTRVISPLSPMFGRGAGGEGKELSKIGMLPNALP